MAVAGRISYKAVLDESGVVTGYKKMATAADGYSKSSRANIKQLDIALKNKEKTVTALFNGFSKITHGLYYQVKAVKVLADSYKKFIGVGLSFESTMYKVAAISRLDLSTDTGLETFKKLNETARAAATTSKYTASETGKALEYLALAGFSVENSIKTLPGLLKLAAAAGSELGFTADLITDQLSALGMAADQAGQLADIFAYTMTTSNVNLEQIAETAKYSSSSFLMAGYSAIDMSAAIGVLGNSGIKASQAGTTLRTMINRLSAPSTRAKKVIEDLGISFADTSTGALKDLPILFAELRDKMSGLNSVQKSEAIFKIFGAESMSGMNILLKSTEGIDEYGNKVNQFLEYRDKMLSEHDGSADKMSATMGMSVQAQINQLKSNFQEFQIVVFDSVKGILAYLVQSLIVFVQSLTQGYIVFATIISNVVSQLGTIFEPVIKAFGVLVGKFSFVTDALSNLSGNTLLLEGIALGVANVISKVLVLALNGLITVINIVMYLFSLLTTIMSSFFSGFNNTAISDEFNLIKESLLNLDFSSAAKSGVNIAIEVMNGFVEGLKGLVSKIPGTVDTFVQSIATVFSNIGFNIPIIASLKEFSSIDAVNNIVAGVSNMLTALNEHPLFNNISDFFSQITNSFVIGIILETSLFTSLSMTVIGFLNKITGLWGNVGAVTNEATKSVGGVAKSVGGAAKSSSILLFLFKSLSISLSPLIKILFVIFGLIKGILSLIGVTKIIIQVFASLLVTINQSIMLISTMLKVVLTILNSIKILFVKIFPLLLITSVVAVMITDMESLRVSINNIYNDLTTMFPELTGFFNAIGNIFMPIINSLEEFKTVFLEYTEYFTGIFIGLDSTIQNVILGLLLIVSGIFTVLIIKLLGIWRMFVRTLSEMLFGISDTSRIVNTIKASNNQLIANFKKLFSNLGETLNKALCNISCDNIVKGFSYYFETINEKARKLANDVYGFFNKKVDIVKVSNIEGEVNALEKNLNQANNKVKDLSKNIKGIKQSKIKLETELTENKNLSSQINSDIKKAQSRLQELSIYVDVNDKKAGAEIDNIKKNINKLSDSKIEIDAKIAKFDLNHYNKLNTLIEENQKNIVTYNDRIRTAENKLNAITKERSQILAKVGNDAQKLTGDQLASYDRLGRSLSAQTGIITTNNNKIKDTIGVVGVLNNSKIKMDADYKDVLKLNDESIKLSNQIKTLNKSKLDIETKSSTDIVSKVAEINALEKELKKLNKQKPLVEVKIESNQQNLVSIKSRLAELQKDKMSYDTESWNHAKKMSYAEQRLLDAKYSKAQQIYNGITKAAKASANATTASLNSNLPGIMIGLNKLKSNTNSMINATRIYATTTANFIERRYNAIPSKVKSSMNSASNMAAGGAATLSRGIITPLLMLPFLMVTAITSSITLLTTAFMAAPLIFIAAFAAIGIALYLWGDSILPYMGQLFTSLGNLIYDGIYAGLQAVVNYVYSTFGSNIGDVFYSIISLVLDVVNSILTMVQGVFTIISGLFKIFTGDFQGGLGTIKDGIVTIFTGLFEYFYAFIKGFFNIGVAIINTIVSGIMSVGNYIYDSIVSVFAPVARLLPHSDAEEGVFSTLTASGVAIPNTIGEGIEQGRGAVESALNYATNTSFDKLIGDAKNAGAQVASFLKDSFSHISGIINPSQEEMLAKEAAKRTLEANKEALSGLIAQARQLTTGRITEYNSQLAGLNMTLKESVKRYEWYQKQAIDSEKAITDEKRRQADAIRNLEREGQNISTAESQRQNMEDLTRLRMEYLDLMRQAEDTSDQELQKQLIDRAVNVAKERESIAAKLRQNEAYEDEKVVMGADGQLQLIKATVSAEESRKMALSEVHSSHTMINEAMNFYNKKAEEASKEIATQTVQIDSVQEKINNLNAADAKITENLDFSKPVETAQYLQDTINQLSTQAAMDSLKNMADYTDKWGNDIRGYIGESLGGDLFDTSFINSEEMANKIASLDETWRKHGGVISTFVDESGRELKAYYENTDEAWNALNAKSDLYAQLSDSEKDSEKGIALANEINMLHEQIQLMEQLKKEQDESGENPVKQVEIDVEKARKEIEEFVNQTNKELEKIKDQEVTVTTRHLERRKSGGFIGSMNLSSGKLLPGYGGGDIVKALLEPGEFVINKRSTRKFKDLLYLINYAPSKALDILKGGTLKFKQGGLIPGLDGLLPKNNYNTVNSYQMLDLPDLQYLIKNNQEASPPMNASFTLNLGNSQATIRTNELDLWQLQKAIKKAGY